MFLNLKINLESTRISKKKQKLFSQYLSLLLEQILDQADSLLDQIPRPDLHFCFQRWTGNDKRCNLVQVSVYNPNQNDILDMTCCLSGSKTKSYFKNKLTVNKQHHFHFLINGKKTSRDLNFTFTYKDFLSRPFKINIPYSIEK